jgi:hypothetical protein
MNDQVRMPPRGRVDTPCKRAETILRDVSSALEGKVVPYDRAISIAQAYAALAVADELAYIANQLQRIAGWRG